ncbi:F5M15.20 [Arabidopsis thaliana]|uniref:F5M15.20 n=1 Tax=Arabidopsis thaliana TaxID=3702 RepID=Q9LMV5_ARATH|nr:F5M15.20 [Arabidopsis thaliana]
MAGFDWFKRGCRSCGPIGLLMPRRQKISIAETFELFPVVRFIDFESYPEELFFNLVFLRRLLRIYQSTEKRRICFGCEIGESLHRKAMITRSNLAEQLREYQIRSKHDWASVSFFSSTSNFSSSREFGVGYVNLNMWKLGQDEVCSIASHLSILRVFSGFLVLQAVTTRIHLGMCHFAATNLHEGHKASEISQEEEAKDASSTLYVKTKLYEKLQPFSLIEPQKTHLLVDLADPITRFMDGNDSYAHGKG